MSSDRSIVSSAAYCCGKPQPIRSVGNSVRSLREQKGSVMFFRFFKHTLIAAACAACSAAMVSTSSADVINVQYPNGSNNGGYTSYHGTGAAPDSGTLWNQANTNTSNLQTSKGITTSVGITNWDGTHINGAFTQTGGDNNALLESYWYLANGSTGGFTIDGLNPSSTYGLYLYAAAGEIGNGQGASFTVNGQNFGETNGAQSSATSTAIPTSDLGITYVTGTATADSTGDITVSFGPNGDPFAGGIFNGFQLTGVAVPEPTTLWLFALAGGVGLLLIGRKRAGV